jgi:glycosyltransferase involved in cell wall biosynthesis
MRIAIDARELVGRPTGVGRYLIELLTAWQASGAADRHTWQLYTHAVPAHVPEAWMPAVTVVPGAGGTRWEQWDFARALSASPPDVLLAPGYTAPLAASSPVALAIHDVSFFAHPEWYGRREGLRRRAITGWSARRATVVLAPSAFSAREIVRFTSVPESRLRIVYLGVSSPATPPRAERTPLVLFAGSLFQRRRVDVLIDAFHTVATMCPDARLDIVGANRTSPRLDFAAQVDALGLHGRVKLRDWVDEATLNALYAEASVFVFLSEYEGFGFTPLEAMANGAVPVVLDTPVAREIYGDAAARVPDGPDLRAAVAAAVTRLLRDPAERVRFQRAAAPVRASYRWADTAARTLEHLEEAARG